MRVDIIIVLDRSGSMAACKPDTIGGFNEFLRKQQAEVPHAHLTLAQFDHEYEVVCQRVPVADAKPLDDATYVPRGNTALLDAQGRTITTLGGIFAGLPDNEKPERVVFMVVTDGQENASHEFTLDQIKKMVTEQTDKWGWEFVYLGASPEAYAASQSMGFMPSNAALTSHASTRAMWSANSDKVSGYSRGLSASMAYTDDEREKMA